MLKNITVGRVQFIDRVLSCITLRERKIFYGQLHLYRDALYYFSPPTHPLETAARCIQRPLRMIISISWFFTEMALLFKWKTVFSIITSHLLFSKMKRSSFRTYVICYGKNFFTSKIMQIVPVERLEFRIIVYVCVQLPGSAALYEKCSGLYDCCRPYENY